MNEKTKQRLVSEIIVPAPTQPVDKLRIGQSPAVASPGTHPFCDGDVYPAYQCKPISIGKDVPWMCYADDE